MNMSTSTTPSKRNRDRAKTRKLRLARTAATVAEIAERNQVINAGKQLADGNPEPNNTEKELSI